MKRIKRIIFRKNREVAQIQTTPKLYLYSLFLIYPSGYTVDYMKKNYPFTAPSFSPEIKYLCIAIKNTRIGIVEIIEPAAI